MKKRCSFVMTVLLLVSLAIPAMAAVPSPNREARPEEGMFFMTSGTSYMMEDTYELANHIHMTEPSMEAERVENYSLISIFDEELPMGALSADVIFYVPGIEKGETILVRVFDDGKWNDVEATVLEDNRVELHLDHSGTVEILKKTEVEGELNVNGDVTVGGGANTSLISPKTGENAAFPTACLMAVGFGIVAVVTGWKAGEQQHN